MSFKGAKFGFELHDESFFTRFKSSDKLIAELNDTWLGVSNCSVKSRYVDSSGPKELGGSVDLVNHYKLQSLHEFFCKRSLPMSVSETPYLQNVVGDREIRKGAGMELDQLSENLARPEEKKGCVLPFRLDVLADVFHMQETATARLSTPDRGTPTAVTKMETRSRDRYHKKNKDRHKLKTRDTKDQSHQNKGKDDNDVKDVKRDQLLMNGQDHMKRQEKKRKHNGVDNPSRAQRHQQMR